MLSASQVQSSAVNDLCPIKVPFKNRQSLTHPPSSSILTLIPVYTWHSFSTSSILPSKIYLTSLYTSSVFWLPNSPHSHIIYVTLPSWCRDLDSETPPPTTEFGQNKNISRNFGRECKTRICETFKTHSFSNIGRNIRRECQGICTLTWTNLNLCRRRLTLLQSTNQSLNIEVNTSCIKFCIDNAIPTEPVSQISRPLTQ